MDPEEPAIIIHTTDGRITSCNEAASRLYGYPAAELVGQALTLIAPHAAEDTALVDQRVAGSPRLARITAAPRRAQRVRRDGSTLSVMTDAQVLRGSSGHPDVVVRVETPLDGSSCSAELNEQCAAVLQLINDIAEETHRSRGAHGAIRQALRRVCDFQGWAIGHARLPGAAARRQAARDLWHQSAAVDGRELRVLTIRASDAAGAAFPGRTATRLSIDQAYLDPVWRQEAERRGLAGVYRFAVRFDGRLLAMLEFFSEDGEEADPLFLAAMSSIEILLAHHLVRRELTLRVAMHVEAEQRELGRSLLDNLAQQISGIGLSARSVQRTLEADAHTTAPRVAAMVRGIEQAKLEAKALTRGLLPVEVHAAGLVSALANLAEQAAPLLGVDCVFEAATRVEFEDSFVATQLFRIARDAVMYLAQDLGARRIRIRATQDGGFSLAVEGSPVERDPLAPPRGEEKRHVMRHRAELIDALLEERAGDDAWTIACSLPGKENQDDEGQS